jgi:hypothetical protein
MRHQLLRLPFACALCVLGLSACDTPTQPSETLPLTRISQGSFSRFETSQRLVVTSQAQLAQVWAAVFGGPTQLPPEMPKIDFSQEMVVVAAAGRRASGDLMIAVESASATGCQAAVTIVSTTLAPSCVTLPVVTTPYDVVRLPAREVVTFTERTAVRNCG